MLWKIQFFACQIVHQEVSADAEKQHQDCGIQEKLIIKIDAVGRKKSAEHHNDSIRQGNHHIDAVIDTDGRKHLQLPNSYGADGYTEHQNNNLSNHGNGGVEQHGKEGTGFFPESIHDFIPDPGKLPGCVGIEIGNCGESNAHQNADAQHKDKAHAQNCQKGGHQAGQQDLVGGSGEGKGHIAFVGIAAFVESPDAEKQRARNGDTHGDKADHNGKHGDHDQKRGRIPLLSQKDHGPHGKTANDSGANADDAQQTQNPPETAPIVL